MKAIQAHPRRGLDGLTMVNLRDPEPNTIRVRVQTDLIRGSDAVHGHPVIDRSFPLAALADAFQLKGTGGHFG